MVEKKYKLTDLELLNHLKIQYDFLLSDIENYENGHHHFAIKIAVTLRTIFHNSATSKAILPALASKYGYKIRFKTKILNSDFVKSCVLYIGFMGGQRIMPRDYFNAPFFTDSDFSTYWNAIVYKEGSVIYTRKQMILFAANRWGGAHVDPEISTKYLHIIDGKGPVLISKSYGEEMIVSRIAYEMAIQVSTILEPMLVILDKKIKK